MDPKPRSTCAGVVLDGRVAAGVALVAASVDVTRTISRIA